MAIGIVILFNTTQHFYLEKMTTTTSSLKGECQPEAEVVVTVVGVATGAVEGGAFGGVVAPTASPKHAV